MGIGVHILKTSNHLPRIVKARHCRSKIGRGYGVRFVKLRHDPSRVPNESVL